MMWSISSTTSRIFNFKSLIALCLFILCVIFYHNELRCTIGNAPLKFLFTSLSSSRASHIIRGHCRLSLVESDDWFCEPDKDWLRRKHLHHIQDKRNRVSDSHRLFFQKNWEPTVHCEFARRLGNTGDGGKWICDVHRMQTMNSTVLIYSFGSKGDFSFEEAVKTELPNAEIHTFDRKIYDCPINVCAFHEARLGDEKDNGSKTIQMIMNELGHRHRKIDILKVDIEGSEYQLFQGLFRSKATKLPYIRQILVEIHLKRRTTESGRHAHALFELFRANNYAIFHKEVNLFNPYNACEYALIRLNAAFFISPLP